MIVERPPAFWLALGLIALIALYILRDVLLPFVAGLGIAYALNPLADRLSHLGLPRIAASALIMLVLAVGIAALAVLVVPTLIAQTEQLIQTLPGEIERLRGLAEEGLKARLGARYPQFEAALDKMSAEAANNAGVIAGAIAQSLWSQGRALIGFLSLAFVTPLVIFYLLADWPKLVATVDGWLPLDQRPAIRRLAGEVNDAVAAFIRGQGLVCISLAIYYTIALTLIGLPYSLLIGIATGLLAFVPFAGWASSLAVSAILAVAQSWPDLGLPIKVLAVYGLGQVIDAGFLSPTMVGPRIGLHPVWLIFALMVFSSLFGLLGVLVAVPVAAALAAVARSGMRTYLASGLYRGRSGADAGSTKAGP